MKSSALPGVSAALPLLEQQAIVLGPHGAASVDLIGADPRFANLGGPLLRKFSARQLVHEKVIALPAPLAGVDRSEPFQDVYVADRSEHGTKRCSAATLSEATSVGSSTARSRSRRSSYAQKLAGTPGRISRLYIKVKPGQQAAGEPRGAKPAGRATI